MTLRLKKLIEAALPLAEINAKTSSEKAGAVGHPANLHMWWGRSPLDSTGAALASALYDAPTNQGERTERIKRIREGTMAEVANRPTVFDPFSGYGAVPLVAQKLNLPVVAGDLNPVAVMLTKAATEIPAKFSGCSPVHPDLLGKKCNGAEGLALDVKQYGSWLRELALDKLSNLYPDESEGKPSAWIWVRTVRCPNPACGCQMPLASSFLLNSKAGEDTWAEPIIEDNHIRFAIRKGTCPDEQRSNKVGKGGAIFRCPICGSLTTDEYVKQMGQKHQLGAQMIAISVEVKEGKLFLPPNGTQENAANCPVPDDAPRGEIPNNPHWFSPPAFGMTSYSDLFSPRQLTMLTTFCELLTEVQNRVAADALAAGMSPSGGSLAEGGTGALAYGQAVSVYLAFVIDKMADANSTICSWRTTGGGLRSTFGRQAIPMVWTFAEGNPFSGITGNYNASLNSVVAAVRALPCGSQVMVYQGDAIKVEYPDNVLICTELPYYKAIGYAHLSDFFYIWMRKSLKSVFPDLFNQMVTSKEELSTVGQYYGVEPTQCRQEYEKNMFLVLQKMYACSNPEYPTLLFFEFHKADEQALSSGNTGGVEASPWEVMMENLNKVGFAVNALWPMRTSAASENADGIRILIVARKCDKPDQVTRRGFIATLKRELPLLIEDHLSAGVDTLDRQIVGLGCGLSVFTRYCRVINADGSDMSVRDAMPLIYQETLDYLAQKNDSEQFESTVLQEG